VLQSWASDCSAKIVLDKVLLSPSNLGRVVVFYPPNGKYASAIASLGIYVSLYSHFSILFRDLSD
jgi:hypothetical protein